VKSRSDAAQPAEGKYLVPVVLSTFRILEELSQSGALTLNEVTARTGVAKSTVFRILNTLNHLGYVSRDGLRTYRVGRAVADLVSDVAITDTLRRVSLPHMLKLRDEFGESVNLGQLQLDKVVYLEVVPSEYSLRLQERPGASVWAHASALGKAILAFSPFETVDSLTRSRELPALTANTITSPEQLTKELQRVRAQGYALDREETVLQASCVAAPILDARGIARAALSISGPTTRFQPRRDERVVKSLTDACAKISAQLSEPPPLPRKRSR